MHKKMIKEHLLEEELSSVLDTRFTQYAFMSLEDRALPDARDGLKPSQRRVLVAMNDLHLNASGSTEKSAKICGDTSGNYHPHGEAIVYPTMYRMVQPWVLRYPLLLGQGNFGNPDGDPPAAMRYCIVGDSLINVGGLKKISSLSSKEDINYSIESIDGTNKASKWFDCGSHPVKQITTRHKYSITGTNNHPLYVISNDCGVPTLKWKLISELSVGDFVVLKRGSNLHAASYVQLQKYFPDESNYSNKVKKAKLPIILDEDFAFVLGSLVAEGTVGDKLNFINSDRRYFSKYRKSWQKCLEEWGCSDRENGNCKSADSCGKLLIDFLANIGLPAAIAVDKSVPFVILESPKSVIVSFLRALYEGDGGICVGPKNSFEITLNSQSIRLIKEVQILLLNLGITSSWYHDVNRDIYKLIIKGRQNFQIFQRDIGFFSIRKKLALAAGNIFVTGKALSKKDFIPYLSDFVRSKAKKNKEFLSKNNFDRIANWKKYKHKIESSLTEEDFSVAKSLAREDFLYDKIISIKDVGEQNVYSVRVDSPCHSFVANGFINHNTESKLSRFGEFMLEDLSEDVVDFQPNYNEKRKEPTILPSLLPNLLINGCEGIAVGWATKMLPHNLKEVVSVIKEYIKNPQVTYEKILKLMPGPDFPTGGKLLGQEGVLDYYKTGRGSIKLEGSYVIEQDKTAKIIISELPYQSSPDQFCNEIKTLVENDKLIGISDLKNLTSKKTGTKIVVEIAKNGNANLILNNLLKLTCLRKTLSVNSTVLIDGKVVPEAPLLELIKAFINHRKQILIKKYQAELAKAAVRVHILDGLIGIVDKIDAVIKVIRTTDSPEDAEVELIVKKFVRSIDQAKAVLSITLRQLTKLEGQKLLDEKNKLTDRLKWLKSILGNDVEISKLIIEEQEELCKKCGDERRTKVISEVTTIEDEDLIKDEQLVISLTGDGYIRSVPLENYRVQGRGGSGSMAVNKNDNPEDMFEIFEANSKHLVLFFTNRGIVYQRKAYEIPVSSKTGKGLHVSNLLNLEAGEIVTNMITIKSLSQKGYLVIVTKNGIIKKTEIAEYDSSRKNAGLTAIALGAGDEVSFACITNGSRDVFIVTAKGQCVRYSEKIIPIQGRATRGSRALRLDSDDKVAQVFTLEPKELPDILVVTAGGFGKKTASDEYKSLTTRQVRGYSVIKKQALQKNGDIVGACALSKDDSILAMTSSGKCIRINSQEIRATGRATTGVRIMKLDSELIVKIAKLSS